MHWSIPTSHSQLITAAISRGAKCQSHFASIWNTLGEVTCLSGTCFKIEKRNCSKDLLRICMKNKLTWKFNVWMWFKGFGRSCSFTSLAVFCRINKHVWLKQRFDTALGHVKPPDLWHIQRTMLFLFDFSLERFFTTNLYFSITSLCTFLSIFLAYFTVWKKHFSQ